MHPRAAAAPSVASENLSPQHARKVEQAYAGSDNVRAVGKEGGAAVRLVRAESGRGGVARGAAAGGGGEPTTLSSAATTSGKREDQTQVPPQAPVGSGTPVKQTSFKLPPGAEAAPSAAAAAAGCFRAGGAAGGPAGGVWRPSVKQQMEQLKHASILRPEQRCIAAFCVAANQEVAACFSRGVTVTSISISPQLEQRCTELEALAAWHCRPLAYGLLSWREEATARARSEFGGASPSDTQELSTLISRVFAAGVLRVLSGYTGSNLDEAAVGQVEDQAIKAVSTGVALDAYRPLLGALSRERMGIMASKLQGLACGAMSDRAQCLRAIDALGSLRVMAATDRQASQGAQYLRLMIELSKRHTLKCMSQEVKHALCAAITDSLSLLASSRGACASGGGLDDALELVWAKATRWAAKAKHQAVAVPLMAAVMLSGHADHCVPRVSVCLAAVIPLIRPHTALSSFTAASPQARASALRTLATIARGLRRPAKAAKALNGRGKVASPEAAQIQGGAGGVEAEEGGEGRGEVVSRACDEAVAASAHKIFQFCAAPSVPSEAAVTARKSPVCNGVCVRARVCVCARACLRAGRVVLSLYARSNCLTRFICGGRLSGGGGVDR